MIRTAILLAVSLAASAEIKVLSTVIEPKTGKRVTDIKEAEFAVTDGGTTIPVKSVATAIGLTDYLLLVDTSVIGHTVQPIASELIAQLQEKEQMAIIAYDSSASVIQDFTSNRDLLARAVTGLKFNDSPRVLDALYAALDGGFSGSAFRKVVIVLSSGIEGPSRTHEREIVRKARENQVSIYPLFIPGNARGLFELLARQTGGAAFNLRDLSKAANGTGVAPVVFESLRSPYTLTLEGNLSLSEKAKIVIRGREKLAASMLPLD